MKNQKKHLMMAWFVFGAYFIIAGYGGGGGSCAIGAMFCGFMCARNMADVVAI